MAAALLVYYRRRQRSNNKGGASLFIVGGATGSVRDANRSASNQSPHMYSGESKEALVIEADGAPIVNSSSSNQIGSRLSAVGGFSASRGDSDSESEIEGGRHLKQSRGSTRTAADVIAQSDRVVVLANPMASRRAVSSAKLGRQLADADDGYADGPGGVHSQRLAAASSYASSRRAAFPAMPAR